MKNTKRAVLVLILAISAAAASGADARYWVTLEDAYPLNPEFEEAGVPVYLLAYFMIRTGADFSLSVSDLLNPGMSFELAQNPASLLSRGFLGSLGVRVFNDFRLGTFIISPYAKTDLYCTSGKNSYGSAYLESYLDFSSGIKASFSGFFLDVAYKIPLLNLTDEAESFSMNAHAVRFGLGFSF